MKVVKRTLDEWEKDLLTDFENTAATLSASGCWRNGEWTKAFLNVLGAHAERLGYRCRSRTSGHEFLWDVAWLSPAACGPKDPWDLKLACEIEWNGYDEAFEDFRKLIHSGAGHALMIFDSEWNRQKCKDRYEEKLQELHSLLPSSEPRKYLLAGVKSMASDRHEDPWLRYMAVEVIKD